MKDETEDEPGRVVALMKRAQGGDRAALDELREIGDARGVSYTDDWSRMMILFRLQDRAGGKNLLARAAVADDLEAVADGLADRRDGPIERLIVGRVALCAVDADLADREHLNAIVGREDPAVVESMDRRRDRAQRRLLSTLRTLADVRRMNRPVVQVNVGENQFIVGGGPRPSSVVPLPRGGTDHGQDAGPDRLGQIGPCGDDFSQAR